MKQKKKQQVIINHIKGEECRIAILEEGVLEEFYFEYASESLHVGNIYLGSVMNVEPAIQAAFIDFGIGRNGFLHISDLHPMYFPGRFHGDTESVGRKTPHRDRPPIQDCLKKGQQVVVQVIKEGIGTKGPTLTSYPSIPGRYLVMMPNMEHHGVTRKLEDFDERREAKKILNSLDLPKEFGFILRTAGLDRPKAEIKRDQSYLARLWKEIERKRGKANGPTELYAESDLLLRTIRDVISPDVERIWVDHPDSLRRIEEYLKIVAPRQRTTKLLLHHRSAPIFHDFGVESQLTMMYAREVPLAGGGSIVIDSAEAMVAIDVNSGKSRKYRDAETMAHQVNLEAVDEIARQLRLRDLGGLIVLDLIDMHDANHQREVETRLRENLKRDRAKTETQRISKFGLLQMTRQRMRPAIRAAHFVECPQCEGRGHIRSTDASIGDALRQLAYLLRHDRIKKVEMVVSTGGASLLLSRKRRQLAAIEDHTGKVVDIRISKALAPDRIDYYAYDGNNADIDLANLNFQQRNPATAEPDPIKDSTTEPPVSEAGPSPTEARSPKRRRRKPAARKERAEKPGNSPDEQNPSKESEATQTEAPSRSGKSGRRSRRRKPSQPTSDSARRQTAPKDQGPSPDLSERTRASKTGADSKTKVKSSTSSRRRRPKSERGSQAEIKPREKPTDGAEAVESTKEPAGRKQPPKSRTRKTQSKRTNPAASGESDAPSAAKSSTHVSAEQKTGDQSVASTTRKKTRRKRSRKKSTGLGAATNGQVEDRGTPSKPRTNGKPESKAAVKSDAAESVEPKVTQPKRRRLYGSRRRLRPDELVKIAEHDG